MNPTEELAAGLGWMDTARIMELLDAGADIHTRGERGRTVLKRAVDNRSLELCTDLLKQGVDLHFRNCYGRTAWDYLHPTHEYIPLYSLFLQYGADVNQYAPSGWTQLHWACRYDHHPTILLLLAKGADPRLPVKSNDKDYNGKTAYDIGTFWCTPEGIAVRNTVGILE